MAQAADGGVGGQLGGQANEVAPQPVVGDVAAAALGGQVNGVAYEDVAPLNMVGNVAPAAPVIGPAAIVVAAMLAVPPGVGMPPRFDADSGLMGPLPTKTNFKDYEIYPRVDEGSP